MIEQIGKQEVYIDKLRNCMEHAQWAEAEFRKYLIMTGEVTARTEEYLLEYLPVWLNSALRGGLRKIQSERVQRGDEIHFVKHLQDTYGECRRLILSIIKEAKEEAKIEQERRRRLDDPDIDF